MITYSECFALGSSAQSTTERSVSSANLRYHDNASKEKEERVKSANLFMGPRTPWAFSSEAANTAGTLGVTAILFFFLITARQ